MEKIAFIGGGNMASAIIGGLIKQSYASDHLIVVEPYSEARQALLSKFGITAQSEPGDFLLTARLVVWAVKPQSFKEAAAQVHTFTREALQLSVAAGIPSSSIAHWLGNDRVVRSMPNTPALIGQGMTGLFAREAVSPNDKRWIEQVVSTMGQFLWIEREDLLNAVTALSGSGPAYVFYFLEAMIETGTALGLTQQQARQLAIETFSGASALARQSDEPLDVLRQRVTSKGGTTHAAISHLEAHDAKAVFAQALRAAEQRAKTLGEEFGAG